MELRFFLDNLTVAEPIGFADLELSLLRDTAYHGIGFEASTGTLQFYGVGADYLRDKKNTLGLKSEVVFLAEADCTGDGGWEELVKGRVNFGKYNESCGDQCLVTVPIEEVGCISVLRARMDQKIDMDDPRAMDRTTALAEYEALNKRINLPAREYRLSASGQVPPEGEQIAENLNNQNWFYASARPQYTLIADESYSSSNLTGGLSFEAETDDDGLKDPISPQLLIEEPNVEEINIDTRLKGRVVITSPDIPGILPPPGTNPWASIPAKVALVKWNGEGSAFMISEAIREGLAEFLFTQAADIPMVTLGGRTAWVLDFDYTRSFVINEPIGTQIYHILYLPMQDSIGHLSADTFDISIFFHHDSYFRAYATKKNPDSAAGVYLAHEALSRLAESITDGCCRVKSSYYGRTDSEPFSFDEDGCGGLYSITGGLKIRNASPDSFFLSLTDALRGFSSIDNIGFAIVPDPGLPGKYLMIIEHFSYFYSDELILALPGIPNASREVVEALHTARIQVGYQKWEVEDIRGLDEVNATREYRTGINTISILVNKMSNFIAGSYAIEITRSAQFSESGASDTTYDNEPFIICLKRDGGLVVEQGNVTGASSMFSPETIYNYRITPIRNLMRLAPLFFSSYVNMEAEDSLLYFSSGTSNYTASGFMQDARCRLEAGILAENEDLGPDDYVDPADAQPLWKCEQVSFEYPLSIGAYRRLKENPYGLVQFQCGTGEVEWGWITELKFQPIKGMADFTLRVKR